MSGYDGKKTVNPLNLMAKRLGVFYQQPTATSVDYANELKDERSLMARRMGLMYNGESLNQQALDDNTINTDSDAEKAILEGIDNQAAMLEYNGGHLQQDRMIYDKRRSLDRALIYSYQGADIKKIDEDEELKPIRVLINPNKVKQDYDDKVISVGYEHGYQPGDVFEWIGTKSYWLIYLQNLTELAYFRGDIRRCIYTINFLDAEKNLKTVYAAVRGPVETKISTVNYNGISHDIPNNSLNILIPKTNDTLYYFNRNNNGGAGQNSYPGVYLKSLHEADKNLPAIKYTVESANWISMPGVIEVTLLEGYSNPEMDDLDLLISNQQKEEEKIVEDFNSEDVEAIILGETFIKPMITQAYTYEGNKNGEFIINDIKKCPLKIIEQDSKHIVVKWGNTYSGQFEIIFRELAIDSFGITTTHDIKKIVVVESLF